VVKSIGFLWQHGQIKASPVLYDRTAANESGPLLQSDRTPEVRITERAFSVSSMIWLAALRCCVE
jgi:hypothetical protein